MIDSGDPSAVKLQQEARGVVMPTLPGMSPAQATALLDINGGLVRVSAGVEDIEDLLETFAGALEVVGRGRRIAGHNRRAGKP